MKKLYLFILILGILAVGYYIFSRDVTLINKLGMVDNNKDSVLESELSEKKKVIPMIWK